jgi:hypothetical protein
MPVPQGDITSSQIFNTLQKIKQEPKARLTIISQINYYNDEQELLWTLKR